MLVVLLSVTTATTGHSRWDEAGVMEEEEQTDAG
jgi:hypothetical protein